MSMGRTGSTFVCSHFKNYTYNPSCKVYNANEFFRFWPMHFYRNIQFLKENNLDIPKSFVDFMCGLVKYKKAHGDKQEEHQWVAPHSHFYGQENTEQKRDDYYLHDGWPYSLNMIDDFCKELKKLNCIDFFIHKHISRITEMNGDEWSYLNVMKKADCILVNYRYSILDVFISLMKAMRSNKWAAKIYDPSYDNKVEWNKDYFVDYAVNRYKASYNGVREALEKLNKPYFTVRYEDFTNPNTDQRKYLSEGLLRTGIFGTSEVEQLLSVKEIKMIKQSKPREFYEDCFSNPEQFKKDYHEIKHLTTFTY